MNGKREMARGTKVSVTPDASVCTEMICTEMVLLPTDGQSHYPQLSTGKALEKEH